MHVTVNSVKAYGKSALLKLQADGKPEVSLLLFLDLYGSSPSFTNNEEDDELEKMMLTMMMLTMMMLMIITNMSQTQTTTTPIQHNNF